MHGNRGDGMIILIIRVPRFFGKAIKDKDPLRYSRFCAKSMRMTSWRVTKVYWYYVMAGYSGVNKI